jgi:hypothetical protein
MDYHILEARHVAGFVVWLRFRDGTAGEIDLGPSLRGPVFEALHDPAYFSKFSYRDVLNVTGEEPSRHLRM